MCGYVVGRGKGVAGCVVVGRGCGCGRVVFGKGKMVVEVW